MSYLPRTLTDSPRMALEAPQRVVTSPTIGFDYSSQGVYLGVVDNGRVLGRASLFSPYQAEPEQRQRFYMNLCTMIVELHRAHKCEDKIYIEKPWVNGARFPLSGLMLCRTATYIEVATLQVNLEPVLVNPGTWRGIIYGHKKQKNTKQAALDFVSKELNYELLPVMGSSGRGKKPDHNIAEAILIAHYGNIIQRKRNGID